MAELAAWALVDLDETKTHLSLDLDLHQNDRLVIDLINECSRWCELYTQRRIRDRGYDLTEFHSFRDFRSFFRSREWPIISITSLHESYVRAWDSSSLLTDNSDFVTDVTTGRFQRITAGHAYPTNFEPGYEHIRLIYRAGYASVGEIPGEIKLACKRYIARLYREVDRREQGVSSKSDQLGYITNFSDNAIPDETREALDLHKRRWMVTGSDATTAVLYGTLTGTVTVGATPIPDATVSVASENLVTTTDANGIYRIANLVPVGSGTVQASKSGSGVGTQSYTIASEGETVQKDIALS